MEVKLSQWYKILAPRSVVLVSTISPEGISNAAPFSFVMPVSINPPLVAFASTPSHDTAKNILKTKEFVVNIPSKDVLDELWTCADNFPNDVSEFKEAGFTEEKSKKIKAPKIKECFARFECKLHSHYETGDHILFVGTVVAADVDDNLSEDGKYLVSKSGVLMHIGAENFGLLGKIIQPKE